MDQDATGLGHQFGNFLPGVGALDGEHGQLGALMQLHCVAAQLRLHPGHVLIARGGVDHQAVTSFGAVDDHVIHHPALLVEHGAV